MANYHEMSGIARTAGGEIPPNEDVGDILCHVSFDTTGVFDIQLLGVAFPSQLSHNLLSFQAVHHLTPEDVDFLASQSAHLRPKRNDESVWDKPVRAAAGSLIW